MQVITVELLNDQAMALLKQLEKLKIIRLVVSKKTIETAKRQWAGSLSKETAIKLLQHIEQSRDEWERNI